MRHLDAVYARAFLMGFLPTLLGGVVAIRLVRSETNAEIEEHARAVRHYYKRRLAEFDPSEKPEEAVPDRATVTQYSKLVRTYSDASAPETVADESVDYLYIDEAEALEYEGSGATVIDAYYDTADGSAVVVGSGELIDILPPPAEVWPGNIYYQIHDTDPLTVIRTTSS